MTAPPSPCQFLPAPSGSPRVEALEFEFVFAYVNSARRCVFFQLHRSGLGQFTSKIGGQAAPGATAVSEFIQSATQRGWSLVDTEVTFNTPFGQRRYDAVLSDLAGVNWGFEIKSSAEAFSRWNAQQFSADRWINMIRGATAVGKQLGLKINGSAKLLWLSR